MKKYALVCAAAAILLLSITSCKSSAPCQAYTKADKIEKNSAL
jgi:hypothetical protein